MELGPAHSGNGPRLADDAVICAERTHAPIAFDNMLASLSTLTAALGPEQGNIGELLSRSADQ